MSSRVNPNKALVETPLKGSGFMYRINLRKTGILLGLIIMIVVGGTSFIHSKSPEDQRVENAISRPITIAHTGGATRLERPAVAFDHDQHTKALKQKKLEDCGVCHVLKQSDNRLNISEIKVFKFPKQEFDPADKSSIMYAYHNACATCHKTMASEGKKTGPQIGMCGKCHDRRAKHAETPWSWKPIFNYARHAQHSQSVDKLKDPSSFNIAGNVKILGEVRPENKNCSVCHHSYDAKGKLLYYKRDTENQCSACHKSTDQKNVRSMKNVAHAACIGCHMKEAALQVADSTKDSKKKVGPIDCIGCHGQQKELTPEEIIKLPRLVRGQKDVMDLTLEEKQDQAGQAISLSRMKPVPYNHKSHEPRAQFCSSCHHHSLEKCSNCHTLRGDPVKGGGVSYERAFHLATAKESCAGCHMAPKKTPNCAGCHQWMPATELPQSSCPICHRGPSDGKLSDPPLITLNLDKEKVPEKISIKGLEREFMPSEFAHAKIANKLNTISNNSTLARTFHASKGNQAICLGCHHRLESGGNRENKFPKCASCHGLPFDPNNPGRLGTVGAYHRQCIGCHEAMNQKPLGLECVKCHAEKPGFKNAEVLVIQKTDQK